MEIMPKACKSIDVIYLYWFEHYGLGAPQSLGEGLHKEKTQLMELLIFSLFGMTKLPKPGTSNGVMESFYEHVGKQCTSIDFGLFN